VNTVLVGIGGLIGSISRFAIGHLTRNAYAATSFPVGTTVVNLLGCLLVGIAAGWGETRHGLSAATRSLLVIGFLGGFTTFSAFGNETVALMRSGHVGVALLSAAVQVLGGLSCVYLGQLAASVLIRS
jgi:CrcB protein